MSLTRIKVCGITRPEDASKVKKLSIDAIGIVFYPPSPRHLADLAIAREIAEEVGPFVTVVGLFVDPSGRQVEDVIEHVPIQLLQFHGEEKASFCESFGRPYIKALRMKTGTAVDGFIDQHPEAMAILLDSYVKNSPGGTGKTFSWARVPQNVPCPVVLAGGLKPDNVASAIDMAHPYAVDTSSGVESAPGIKDFQKMTTFVQNVKAER